MKKLLKGSALIVERVDILVDKSRKEIDKEILIIQNEK